jgi:DHA2 family multidrug resistance protein-like MFS transporter
MACFMSGAAIGPIADGLMLEHFWWGSVFLLAVPAMVLLLILGPVVLPEYRDPVPRRLDLGSVLLSLAAILPVAYALTETARTGLLPLPAAAGVAGLALGAVSCAGSGNWLNRCSTSGCSRTGPSPRR